MTEPEREAFLAEFAAEGGRARVGLAVMGGAFGEGIDLPGTRLIGAFIATLGLPQVSPVNDEMQRRMESRFRGGVMYYIEMHAHMVSRTTDDYRDMAMAGCVAVISRCCRRSVRS